MAPTSAHPHPLSLTGSLAGGAATTTTTTTGGPASPSRCPASRGATTTATTSSATCSSGRGSRGSCSPLGGLHGQGEKWSRNKAWEQGERWGVR